MNRPLPLYVVPDAELVRHATSARPCRAGQLRVRQGRTAVGLGNRLEELVFTNVGARACLLRGHPTISAETPKGARLTLHPRPGGTYFGRLDPADLPPGGHVFLDLATSTACDGGRRPAVRYRKLGFGLPQGGTVRTWLVVINEVCGLSMSDFGLPRRYAQPRPAPGTAGVLLARLQLPAEARAGATLRYVVALRNPTDAAVALRPCPGYTEGLFAPGLAVRRSFALNCDTVRTIPAHRHLLYAMRLTLPRRARPGIAKLGWNLNTPAGPFAGGVIRILRP